MLSSLQCPGVGVSNLEWQEALKKAQSDSAVEAKQSCKGFSFLQCLSWSWVPGHLLLLLSLRQGSNRNLSPGPAQDEVFPVLAGNVPADPLLFSEKYFSVRIIMS